MIQKTKSKILLCFLICFLCLSAMPVNAQKMSVSDLGLIGPQDVQIYRANGTLVGTYNTTSNGIDLPEEDFMIVFKPETKSRWFDPTKALSDGFAWVETYWVQIVVVLAVLGAGAFLWRKG